MIYAYLNGHHIETPDEVDEYQEYKMRRPQMESLHA